MATLSIVLNVKDLPTSLAAYKALGFKVDDAWKDAETGAVYYADLSFDGVEVGLAHIPSNDDPDFQKWVSTPLGAGVVPYVSVRDVDKIVAKAKGSGFLIEVPPTDRPYGRIATLNDPDGYTWSFIRENPPAPKKKAATKKAKPAVRKTKAKAKTTKRR